MAAGLGYIEFATGDILTAAAANGYLASQTVMVFANAAARTSAITSPQEGMFSYLKDTNATEYYSGSAWVALGGGSSGGMTLLSTTTLSGSSTTISSIDQTYNSLYILVTGISVSATSGAYPAMQINGTANLASTIRQIGTGGTATTQSIAAGDIQMSSTEYILNNTNNAWSIIIDNYASTSNYKPYRASGQFINSASATVSSNGGGNVITNSAISSLKFTCDTSSYNGGTVRIYGVK
jgi:hypothetical protein